jgi:hypothetical protein
MRDRKKERNHKKNKNNISKKIIIPKNISYIQIKKYF